MFRTFLLLGMILFILAGCGSEDRLQSSDAGKTTAFSPGTPDFDFEAVETIHENASGADLFFRIPWSSLVFVRDSAGFAAQYELRAKFIPELDSIGTRERSWDRILRSDGPVSTRSTEENLDVHRMPLPEGRYIAEAVLEDLQTGITAARRQGITVFGPDDSCARLLRITLEHSFRGSFVPFLPLHIPEGVDSLQAVVTLRNPRRATGGGLFISLLRYPTDSLPSSLPYYLSPPQGSVRRTAVDFRKADTLLNRTIPLSDGPDQTMYVNLSGLGRGYCEVVARCTARACGSSVDDYGLERSRGLAIVNETFPRVTTLRRMLEPLLYIATEKEYREILEAKTDKEMRSTFERFWLHLGGIPEKAAYLIRQYYSRVEEANLFYSAYKEGWKTDRGMIYVIFGAPGTITRGNRQVLWSYASGYAFLFEIIPSSRSDEPFENWALVRDASYEKAWTIEVDRWRRGQSF